MDDRHRDRGPGHDRSDRGSRDRERGGPEETTFLDLEISKVLAGEAESLGREAAREILKDAIKARLRERLGDRLERLGRLAADELADDIEANLDIESRIAARREARRSLEERVGDALAARGSPSKGRRR